MKKKGSKQRPLYTIGHSTHSAAEFIEILRTVSVTQLVDIRSFPRSAKNPQFNIEVLPETLAAAGITYVHLVALGGRRKKSQSIEPAVNAGWQHRAFHNYADYAQTAPFADGLRQLLELVSRETCAIMCSEAVWWRCHRHIVSDYVLTRDVPVIHLFTKNKAQAASVTPFAVVKPRAGVSYPSHPQEGAVTAPG